MDYKKPLIKREQIEQAILLIRGQRVMLDRDLAALYGVTTGNLNKAVQRNSDRFPADFMFQLTLEEAQACAGSRFPNWNLETRTEHQVFAACFHAGRCGDAFERAAQSMF